MKLSLKYTVTTDFYTEGEVLTLAAPAFGSGISLAISIFLSKTLSLLLMDFKVTNDLFGVVY